MLGDALPELFPWRHRLREESVDRLADFRREIRTAVSSRLPRVSEKSRGALERHVEIEALTALTRQINSKYPTNSELRSALKAAAVRFPLRAAGTTNYSVEFETHRAAWDELRSRLGELGARRGLTRAKYPEYILFGAELASLTSEEMTALVETGCANVPALKEVTPRSATRPASPSSS